MTFALRGDLTYCHVDGRLFVLDLRRCRYFRLTDQAALAFEALERGDAPSSGDVTGFASLRGAGLLADGQRQRLPKLAVAPVAVDSLVDTIEPVPFALSAWRELLRFVWVSLVLRTQGLPRLVQTVERRKADGVLLAPSLNDEPLNGIVRRFLQLDTLIGRHDRCLPRSAAMMMALAKRGYPASMIFGVSGRPFTAHCWVQIGTTVLSDRLEQVRSFTPILVI